MIKRVILSCIAVLSLLLLFFAVKNYRDSRPTADEILFGLAHSLHAAIEFSVANDPSLHSLSTFHSHDLAYFALVDANGIYRYHTNPDLVGTRLLDKHVLQKLLAETMTGSRVKLATGQDGYELFSHVHTHDEGTLGLHLVLYAHRADIVIHNALVNMLIMISLLLLSWILIAVIFRYTLQEEKHKLELATRDNLARMGEMGAMLAHEIRNPLAGIKGFAQLIEKKTGDAHTKDYSHRILSETLRLEELTTDLLTFARSDKFTRQPVNLAELVRHTVDLIHTEAELALIAIEIDSPLPLYVSGDRDRLTQVLLNVVRNGLQAMTDGGNLWIAIRRSGSDIEIRIRDNGHGISAENMAKIFDPFFTTKTRGTGLGLALCNKIVTEHNGTIHIESSPGGTTVTIVLPEAREEETA
jgi:two-component system sensor histidine kinase HydH